MKTNTVAFEWALRDLFQGRRLIGIAVATLVPSLFVLIVMVGRIDPDFKPEIVAFILTVFIMPPLVAVIALVVGGTVLRGPMEDGTILYMLTRPVKRFQVGVLRGAAVALAVALATATSGFLVALLLGEVGMAFQALPGLLSGGFALGALYGLILSLHRFALGAVLVHAVLEASIARIPFERLTQWTITWHAWGGMGRVTDVAVEEFILPNSGGNVFIPILMGLLSLLLIGLLYQRKAFGLGVAEA